MKQRVVTGLLAAAIFIGLLYVGGIGFSILITLLAVIGCYEFLRMNGIAPFRGTAWIAYVAVIVLTLPWEIFDWNQMELLQWSWLTMFIFLAMTVLSKNKVHIEHAAILFIGTFYIGVGFHYMLLTRLGGPEQHEHGLFWALFIFICIWVSDIGAYFTGRIMGKHLLWPVISPKKTVEGALGGFTLSIITAILFSLYAPGILQMDIAIWTGAFIGVVGQLGDFIQSAYKRIRGVKDSGTLFPGHGGVLDRCDSWIIVFPFLYALHLLPF